MKFKRYIRSVKEIVEKKIHRIDTQLVQHIEKEKVWGDPIYKIRDEKKNIATDTTDVQRIIRNYYKHTYIHTN